MSMLRGLVLVAAVFLAGCVPSQDPGVPTNATPEVLYDVPDFSLTERTGKTITREDLKGKVWVASFVFTRCSGPCPAVTATVARLQAELADEPNVRFVTFTVDPERDDPAELTKYAERYRADGERWLFLTGPEASVHSLMNEGFKIAVSKKADGAPGDEFDHSTRLVLVDQQGRIRGYYDGMPPDRPGAQEQYESGLKSLQVAVRALVQEAYP